MLGQLDVTRRRQVWTEYVRLVDRKRSGPIRRPAVGLRGPLAHRHGRNRHRETRIDHRVDEEAVKFVRAPVGKVVVAQSYGDAPIRM